MHVKLQSLLESGKIHCRRNKYGVDPELYNVRLVLGLAHTFSLLSSYEPIRDGNLNCREVNI